jgi:hypothetical protein
MTDLPPCEVCGQAVERHVIEDDPRAFARGRTNEPCGCTLVPIYAADGLSEPAVTMGVHADGTMKRI